MTPLATLFASIVKTDGSDASFGLNGEGKPVIGIRIDGTYVHTQIDRREAEGLLNEILEHLPKGKGSAMLTGTVIPPQLERVRLQSIPEVDGAYIMRAYWKPEHRAERPMQPEPETTADAEQARRNAAARAEAMALLEPHRRPVWIPQVTDGDPGPTASKYAGAPWLRAHTGLARVFGAMEPWPRLLDEPARFILQIDVTTLPGPARDLLGGTGLLQLFYRSAAHRPWSDDEADLALVRLVHPEIEPGAAVPPPDGIPEYGAPRRAKAILGWEERTDLPRSEDYDAATNKALRALSRKHRTEAGDLVDQALQGDKLGGWPFWYQAPREPVDFAGDPMVPLYQIDAGVFCDGPTVPAHAEGMFPVDGTGHIYVSRNDPHELLFLSDCG